MERRGLAAVASLGAPDGTENRRRAHGDGEEPALTFLAGARPGPIHDTESGAVDGHELSRAGTGEGACTSHATTVQSPWEGTVRSGTELPGELGGDAIASKRRHRREPPAF